MTNTTAFPRRLAIIAAAVVGVLVLSYGGWLGYMSYVTFASDADCAAAKGIVRGGGTVADAAGASAWAAGARPRGAKIEHEHLKTSVTKYIDLVERTFTSSPPDAVTRSRAAGDLFDACRDIDVDFPKAR
jgi:hypothetical protein